VARSFIQVDQSENGEEVWRTPPTSGSALAPVMVVRTIPSAHGVRPDVSKTRCIDRTWQRRPWGGQSAAIRSPSVSQTFRTNIRHAAIDIAYQASLPIGDGTRAPASRSTTDRTAHDTVVAPRHCTTV
jgi:hypothetical protein